MKPRVEYGKLDDINKFKIGEEETQIDGVKHYKLKNFYLPVLNRKHINSFNPQKTCISLCGNEAFELENEDEFIKSVIESVEKLKKYHLECDAGEKENIGEYSLFDCLKIPKGYMLDSYTFDRTNNEGDYYLILWITPQYSTNMRRRHLYWYGEKNNINWY